MGDVKHTPAPWSVSEVRTVEGGFMVLGGEGFGFGLIAEVTMEDDARLIAAAPGLLSDGWVLAVMALQSARYGEDAEFRDAVDAMLDTCRTARGEPTREQYLSARAAASKAEAL